MLKHESFANHQEETVSALTLNDVRAHTIIIDLGRAGEPITSDMVADILGDESDLPFGIRLQVAEDEIATMAREKKLLGYEGSWFLAPTMPLQSPLKRAS